MTLRADRRSRVKPVEADASGCHAVEIGRFQNTMAVVAGIPPALVVGHREDDVWKPWSSSHAAKRGTESGRCSDGQKCSTAHAFAIREFVGFHIGCHEFSAARPSDWK